MYLIHRLLAGQPPSGSDCLRLWLSAVLPTLLELGGVPMPTNETYDGVSLVPLVAGTATTTGKNMSFSQYARDEPLHPEYPLP